MSELNQYEQTAIIKDAMVLTASIKQAEDSLRKINGESFTKQKPVRPRLHEVHIPEIQATVVPKPQVRYDIMDYIKDHKLILLVYAIPIIISLLIGISDGVIGILVSFVYVGSTLSFVISIILFAVAYSRASSIRKTKIQESMKSDEYIAKVEEAKAEDEARRKQVQEECEEKQKQYNEEFEKATQKYNELLPLYNIEMDTFNNIKMWRINNLKTTISLNKEALENLYTSTRLVSASYRDLAILQWLYEDMSTSDHDLRYAMELLDRDRQRVATLQAAEITAKAIAMQTEIMHEDMGEMYDELLRGNESLEDIMNGQSKLRRDNNIANGVGIFQRWLYHKN